MQFEETALCLWPQLRLGEEVEKLLIGVDSTDGGRLVETWLGCTLKERLTDIERGMLGKLALRIALIELLEGGRSRLVIAAHILCHAQHIERFLSFVGALLHRDHILQQGDGTLILALGEALLGIFVAIIVVGGLVNFIKFTSTATQKQCQRTHYYHYFLHARKI